ncbi:MAG: hypothetical protein KDA98_00430 [Acidimicrobiales bacterium]|nr:hypothetical protein [Acidimicrobiales bacterium]
MSERRRGERASAVLGAIATIGLLAALTAGLAHVGSAAATQAGAQAAADAAALAGAVAGPSAAAEAAARNDAVVRAFRTLGDDVVVTVERRGASARARARSTPVAIP